MIMFRLVFYILIAFMSLSLSLCAQAPKKPTSSEIYHELEKFGALATVLYVAAHPDDENTRLISWFANEKKAEAYYISLTRGDGGQNLIGPEINELLGVIRTQELLEARKVDGGKQLFTRANDFGFSKNAEETVKIWDDDKVKHDIVWAIRKTKPDIIINRFDHRTSGSTHGHHTASARLALDVFGQAGDTNYFPEQLKYVQPWSARRIFFNTSWWFYGSQEKFRQADKSNLLSMDIGVYYPLLGKSNTEIAAESRTKHKCQGFGSTGTRGSQSEYMELLSGDMPADKENPFEGIDITWTRVPNGLPVKKLHDEILREYDFSRPYLVVPKLVKLLDLVELTGDEHWKSIKIDQLKEIIAHCLGLYVEAVATQQTAVPGETVKLELEVIKRLPGDVEFIGYEILPSRIDSILRIKLEDNEVLLMGRDCQLNADLNYSTPYWLTKKSSLGMYEVDNPLFIGLPETPRDVKVNFRFNIFGKEITLSRDVVYKFNSPETGETYRPFQIVPPVYASTESKVFIAYDNRPFEINVTVRSMADNQQGVLTIPVGKGWRIEPTEVGFDLKLKNDSKQFKFLIYSPDSQSILETSPVIKLGGQYFDKELIEVKYDHIPHQMVLMPVTTKLVRLNLDRTVTNIAYVMGAGDEIPFYLTKSGFKVTLIEPSQISQELLSSYDVLVFGVRAFNKHEELKFKTDEIFNYVENGGTVFVQYNVSRGLVTDDLAPFKLKLGRDRVTVEEAEMRILDSEHPIVNYPNKLNSEDFDGWVQERGLYFASEWADEFKPIFSCNDPGETPKEGALLVANYGKGYYIYSGLSFFRQLPAGVPGAYRLISNILSIGKKSDF